MPQNDHSIRRILHDFEQVQSVDAYAEQLRPAPPDEIAALPTQDVPGGAAPEQVAARRQLLWDSGHTLDYLSGTQAPPTAEDLRGNIENYIGMAQLPVGIAGPLHVRGTQAHGDYYVPLATTEGALVASYNRGMKACRMSGGISSACLVEGVQRSPFFKFRDLGEVGIFIKWVHDYQAVLEQIIGETSRFAQLAELRTSVEGNSVILTFEYRTGDAAGQNMVTICTDRICKYLLANTPVQPTEWYIESNYAGDKKATALSFSNVRGKKVTAECRLPSAIVADILKTTPTRMAHYWQSSTLAVIQSGAIGAQGHVANGLTALYIACGQDVACIAESSVGITRMQATPEGDLYAAVTLPSLTVGTVGGGTGLPTQRECLALLDCAGAGKARKFAEICGAVALAGELSIAAAMSVDHFTNAHQSLGRSSKPTLVK